jgi:hypothetical protein
MDGVRVLFAHRRFGAVETVNKKLGSSGGWVEDLWGALCRSGKIILWQVNQLYRVNHSRWIRWWNQNFSALWEWIETRYKIDGAVQRVCLHRDWWDEARRACESGVASKFHAPHISVLSCMKKEKKNFFFYIFIWQ